MTLLDSIYLTLFSLKTAGKNKERPLDLSKCLLLSVGMTGFN